MAAFEPQVSIESNMDECIHVNSEEMLEIEIQVKHVIMTMLWCSGGLSLKAIRENSELVLSILKSVQAKLDGIRDHSVDTVISDLVVAKTCPETMGRIMVLLDTESQKRASRKSSKFKISSSSKSGHYARFLQILRQAPTDAIDDPSSRLTHASYVSDCKFHAENPGKLKKRVMQRQANMTENMPTAELARFRQAREQNSFFQIQAELRKWLQNSKTSKLLLAIMAHDLTLQHIDNYRQDIPDITQTTFLNR